MILDKIYKTKEKFKEQFKKIEEKGEKVEYRDLDTLEIIISKDNTEPMFIISYLKLVEKFENDKYSEKIKKYLPFLPREVIKQHFPSYYKEKKDSSSLFKNLLETIESFRKYWDIMKKIMFYNKLDIKNKDEIKGVSEYSSNKELVIYNLYRRISKGIIQHINNFHNFKPLQNNLLLETEENSIKEAKIFLKVENFISKNSEEEISEEENKIYNNLKSLKNYNAKQTIKESEKKIDLIRKISSEEFSIYFTHFKDFLRGIKKNFNLRFKNMENLENKDISLLIEFCFFLENYNFEGDLTNFYIDKWNDTFYQTKEIIEEEIKNNSKVNLLEYTLINKDMVITQYKHSQRTKDITFIKNIDKYSINCVIDYFNLTINTPRKKPIDNDTNNYSENKKIFNDYYLENFLKFDSKEDLYINKIWDIYEDYLIQIFTSKTIKTAVEQMFSDLKMNNIYELLNPDNLKIIFKRSKFYGFETNTFGLTEPLFLLDFVRYMGLIKPYGEEISKLFNFCIYQIIQENEILGHIEMRVQDYISEQEIKSPKLDYIDNSNIYKNIKGHKSGKYIEKLLYGEYLGQLSYNQILFILDIENYKVDYNVFRTNFQKCENGLYKISESLKKFVEKINIELNPNYFGLQIININRGLVGKTSSNNNSYLYQRMHTHLHPSKDDYISLQDIIDKYEQYKLSH